MVILISPPFIFPPPQRFARVFVVVLLLIKQTSLSFLKKVKKSVDTYSVYFVYLDIRFREKRRMLTKTNHLLSLMAFREIKS